jgi:hypothetical protein
MDLFLQSVRTSGTCELVDMCESRDPNDEMVLGGRDQWPGGCARDLQRRRLCRARGAV